MQHPRSALDAQHPNGGGLPPSFGGDKEVLHRVMRSSLRKRKLLGTGLFPTCGVSSDRGMKQQDTLPYSLRSPRTWPPENAMTRKVDSECEAIGKVFSSELQKLYLLAHILTGSPDAASECIVEAFERLKESFLASPDFAYEAAKVATIRASLRRVAPEIRHLAFQETTAQGRARDLSLPHRDLEITCRENLLRSILQLNAFHRAVVLLRLYERYRIYAVSLLLRIPASAVQQGLVKALPLLMSSIHGDICADQKWRGESVSRDACGLLAVRSDQNNMLVEL